MFKWLGPILSLFVAAASFAFIAMVMVWGGLVPIFAPGPPVSLLKAGQVLWFEYHGDESHESGDAQVWYRSHQRCLVIGVSNCDGLAVRSQKERFKQGVLIIYRVRFADSLEWDVFEDELMDEPNWQRPDPPAPRRLNQ